MQLLLLKESSFKEPNSRIDNNNTQQSELHMWQGETILLICTGEPYFVFHKNSVSRRPNFKGPDLTHRFVCAKTHTNGLQLYNVLQKVFNSFQDLLF